MRIICKRCYFISFFHEQAKVFNNNFNLWKTWNHFDARCNNVLWLSSTKCRVRKGTSSQFYSTNNKWSRCCKLIEAFAWPWSSHSDKPCLGYFPAVISSEINKICFLLFHLENLLRGFEKSKVYFGFELFRRCSKPFSIQIVLSFFLFLSLNISR